MGITGWRIREARLRAKYGVQTEPGLTLISYRYQDVAEFSVGYEKGSLVVVGPKGGTLATFHDLKKGDVRGWQHLRFEILEVVPERLRVEPLIQPGAPCTGTGVYHAVKAGLRIEFPGEALVTVLSVPPSTWRVRLEGGGNAKEVDLPTGKMIEVGGLRLRGDADALVAERPDQPR